MKYCVSKSNIIFTNPNVIPSIDGRVEPTEDEKKTYYSFINLKVIDTANYSYKFKLFFPDEALDTYRYITDVSLDNIDSIVDDYDTDLTLPLQVNSPFRFTESPQNPGGTAEDAIFEVSFVGQVVQLKSDDGDGFRNEARYTWTTKIISPGKGFRKGEVYRETSECS